ncbi:hypothetical protein BGW36DRAFT_430053 [Talaromyces proteolyticus]|uniref:Uncharacterized protein n=1 Tax=Talaromyces proteolyticus TaxID=1131652 RepID=A0AAD4PXX7_9EURO|nr:uncharacterized protein BGW36DRAFT_430053 [Talaromyces proteolyticus]KAH8694030.1 hypothetical protein BGW36DRAFT_430053 [Talaromyces proteolyticus]
MLFPKALLFAAAVTAWTIPEDIGDGIYTVSTNDQGETVHNFVANLTAVPDAGPKSAKFRRQGLSGANNIQCFYDNLNHADTDAVNVNIDNQCGSGGVLQGDGSENGRDFYAVQNDVVSYVCNLSGNKNNCYASERQAADRLITADCGWYASGEDNAPDRSIVYGYQPRDSDFCGRGINGK